MPHSVHAPSGSPTPDPDPSQQTNLPVAQRFWNTNLPSSKWIDKCPDYLLGQSQKNIGILASPQSDYHVLTWPECKELVRTNKIDHFQRPPLDLRRYLQFMFKLKQQYGSVLRFVQKERLHWESISPSGDRPFDNPADYTILYNDWPYGIDRDVVHLVVWTKFLLEDDPDTGFLTTEYHGIIEEFVQSTFCGRQSVERENLIWFKNWKSLKSVHALEHFHVMLYRAPARFLGEVTRGDRPMSEIVLADT